MLSLREIAVKLIRPLTLGFLLLAYFSQTSPHFHIHPCHLADESESHDSAHAWVIDRETEHCHDHGEPDQHPDNHHHTFDKHSDWHAVRLQVQSTTNPAKQFALAPGSSLYGPGCIKHTAKSRDFFVPTDSPHQSRITRGPPSLA